MKIIIAGGRHFSDYSFISDKLTRYLADKQVQEIVSGGCSGADLCAERYADENKIPKKVFKVTKADWNKCGKSAGPRRNQEMANYGDFLIAFWDGKSRGTKNMIESMKKLNKEGIIVKI